MERVTVYQDSNNEWRWRFKASNGRVMADSGEGYQNKQDALTAIDAVFGGLPPEVVDEAGEQLRVVPNDPALEAALTLLTLMTGDDWDRPKLVKCSASLRQHACATLVKQGVGVAEAEAIVGERWAEYGSPEPAEDTPVAATADRSAEANVAPKMDLSPGTPPTGEELRLKARSRIDRWRKERAGAPEDSGSDT
ncbi:gp41 [Mycobacterium phage PLot]|uniref:DUF1508 domain-containing protein n=4 Tax=Plotvirus plot TaxID=2170099 RepID=Q19YA8_9CAUD|nr:gp41 [Mycobacterium phage PLot]ABD58640.1 hypothetical protein PBI_PLOT_41 [Mycobacterium phage PLot]QBI97106.1 hypothetical protein SEA_CHILL_42 [Mycobacterium phage Chill]QBP30039.1 hypothetical protein SEA_WALDOWHY_42 [Mycobacterium phage WaldoWhy]QFG14190.1 hypothetical protein SEA_GIUSEPPE_41 [Mycobacterium phage Giuseppe]